MKVDRKTRTLIVTNRRVVDFVFREENEALLKMLDNVLENLCDTLEDYMEKQATEDNSKKEMTKMMKCLRLFEERIKQQMDDLGDSLDDHLQQAKTQVSERVSVELSYLSRTLSQTLISTIEQLNMERVSREICERLKETLSSSNKDLQNIAYEIEKEVRKANEKLSEQLVTALSHLKNESGLDTVTNKLQEVQTQWNLNMTDLVNKMKNLDERVTEEGRINVGRHVEQNEQMKNMPITTKLVLTDLIKDVERENMHVSSILNESQRQLARVVDELRDNKECLNFVRDRTERITDQVVEMEKKLITQQTKAQHCVNSKGKEGEDKLLELLQERLMTRDGYTIEKVSGQSMNCDIVVKRNEYPPIRIESKAIGKETGEKVRSKDVEKFVRDLNQLNNHGILVSLYSGIVGIGNIELQQLPNGKFAIYLGNNNFDVDLIIDMIQLLYKLDGVCSKDDGGKDIKLTKDSLSKVQGYLKDYTNKITQIKAHLKESLTLVSEIQLDMIEKIIMGQKEGQKERRGEVLCEDCGGSFQNVHGLNIHKRRCAGVAQKKTIQ